MFRHKIVRSDGITEVLGVKEGSFHYHEQIDTNGDIKVGNVVSAYLSFDFYVDVNGESIPEGEELTYYQVKDFNRKFEETETIREIQIGKFTVYSSEPNKTTCHIVAYDNIAKLDIDYSPRLKALENNFPMKIIDLLDDAAAYAGVTSGIGHSSLVTLVSNADLSSFYSDNITVRDIFSYIGTILGTSIKALSNGDIGTVGYSIIGGDLNWYRSDYYIICPTDQQIYIHPLYDQTELIPVFYKQDGLTETDFTVIPFDSVSVYKSDGSLFGSYSSGTENNPYIVSSNLLIDFISSGADQLLIDRMTYAIYSELNDAQIHTPLKVRLFPFRCPYRVGAITYLYDISGNIVEIPIMSMDWTDSEVVVEVFGEESTNDSFSQYSTADNRTTVLSALVNGKVSKSGDTMTGNLTIEEDYGGKVAIKNDDVTVGVTPSIPDVNNPSTGQYQLLDSADTLMSWFSGLYTGGRQVQTRMGARNKNENDGNANVDNQLILSVSRTGVRGVTITEAAPWRKALELGDTNGAFPLTIAQGGTGGTTIATALNSLGIKGFQISSGQSQTINFSGNGCFVFGARGDTSFVAVVDYWSGSVNVLPIGSGGAGVTITKTANAHSITITNTRSSLAIIGAVIPATTV